MERYFKAWDDHDLETLQEIFGEDAVVQACHPEDVAGEYRGLDEFLAWHDRKRELGGPSYGYRLQDLLVGDRHAVALFKLISSREGRAYEWHQTAFYHLDGEKIVAAWVHQEPVREVEDGADVTGQPMGWVTPPLR